MQRSGGSGNAAQASRIGFLAKRRVMELTRGGRSQDQQDPVPCKSTKSTSHAAPALSGVCELPRVSSRRAYGKQVTNRDRQRMMFFAVARRGRRCRWRESGIRYKV